jgi:transcriptional regulator GlxA family with amidase domain
VVVDGNLITSQGPGTALDFALQLVEQLCGVVKREEVGAPMVLTTSATAYY